MLSTDLLLLSGTIAVKEAIQWRGIPIHEESAPFKRKPIRSLRHFPFYCQMPPQGGFYFKKLLNLN
jgi:hypothetical protein